MRDRHAAELEVMKGLWREQQGHFAREGAFDASSSYVATTFAMDVTIRRRLINVDLMEPHVRGRVLEWGCNFGFDSCVFRLRLGDGVELHGTDLFDPRAFRPFHEHSGLDDTRLEHPYLLPYPDAFFDVVTSDGVLEHVPEPESSVRRSPACSGQGAPSW
jgi:SAM-dependent methyltransferase